MPQERSKKDQRNGGYTKEFQQYFFKALILSIFGFENVLEILYNLEKRKYTLRVTEVTILLNNCLQNAS